MKILLSIFLVFSPLLIFAEYNGVHVEFDLHLHDGSEVRGYRFLAHGNTSEDYRKQLEANPETLLMKQYSFEVGEYGYYQKRLEYLYNEILLYKLIEPVGLELSDVKSLSVQSLILASYAVTIGGDYVWEDREWMNTKPLLSYSEDEGMCTYDIFIHQTEKVSDDVIENFNFILEQSEIEVQEKAEELGIKNIYDEAFEEQLNSLYDKRNSQILILMEKNKALKSVVVGLCTC